MNLIDDITIESLYSSDRHRLDAIEHSLNVDDKDGDEFTFIRDNNIIEDDSDIPYDKELSRTDNRVNRSQNLSWDEISELEDI
tara:strand:- start:688 stop:936 length:249 start_codon:yes stop_codon:yes gene_type:complete